MRLQRKWRRLVFVLLLAENGDCGSASSAKDEKNFRFSWNDERNDERSDERNNERNRACFASLSHVLYCFYW